MDLGLARPGAIERAQDPVVVGQVQDGAHRRLEAERCGRRADGRAAGDDRPVAEDRPAQVDLEPARVVAEDDRQGLGLARGLDVGRGQAGQVGLARVDGVRPVAQRQGRRPVRPAGDQRRDPEVTGAAGRVGERDGIADPLTVDRIRARAEVAVVVGERAAERRGAGGSSASSSATRRTQLIRPLARWNWRSPGRHSMVMRQRAQGCRAGSRTSGTPRARRGRPAACRGRRRRCRGRGAPRRGGRWSPGGRTSSRWWVAAARSMARWWVAETCPGVSEPEADPLPRRRVGQLQPAHVGMAAVLLRPDVRHGLVGDGGLVDRDDAAALAVGVRLVRAGAEPAQRLQARLRLEDEADTRQVRRGRAGWSTASSTRTPPSPARRDRPLVADDVSGSGR